jgi:hypothetical protein
VSQWKLQVNSNSGISFQWSYAVTAAAIFGEFDLVLRVAVVVQMRCMEADIFSGSCRWAAAMTFSAN